MPLVKEPLDTEKVETVNEEKQEDQAVETASAPKEEQPIKKPRAKKSGSKLKRYTAVERTLRHPVSHVAFHPNQITEVPAAGKGSWLESQVKAGYIREI